MELGFLAAVPSGTSTEQEVTWYYFCTGEEVERVESTAVRYLMQRITHRPCTLECTRQMLVSGRCIYTPPLFNYSHTEASAGRWDSSKYCICAQKWCQYAKLQFGLGFHAIPTKIQKYSLIYHCSVVLRSLIYLMIECHCLWIYNQRSFNVASKFL